MSNQVCEHGSLARHCELCERDENIRELESRMKAQDAESELLVHASIGLWAKLGKAESRVKELEEEREKIAPFIEQLKKISEAVGDAVRGEDQMSKATFCQWCAGDPGNHHPDCPFGYAERAEAKVKELEEQIEQLRVLRGEER